MTRTKKVRFACLLVASIVGFYCGAELIHHFSGNWALGGLGVVAIVSSVAVGVILFLGLLLRQEGK